MGSGIVYALTSPSGLLCREWEDEAVVFNPVSGSTHRLPAAAVDVLRLLEAQPASHEEVVGTLARLVPEREADLQPWIAALLVQLERAGLVERR